MKRINLSKAEFCKLPIVNSNSQELVEHLKLIQGVVNRMAGNCARLKTWAVALITVIFIFSIVFDDAHWLIGVGGCIPIIAFWIMDANYLHLERCYIALYEQAIAGRVSQPFDLNYRPYKSKVESIWSVAWSWSVFGFYGSLLFVMITLVVFIQMSGD